mmetsp:Transcript_3550/g.10334  ORF Transcript_3550/g.10334 Transcript_3550/m.10334 type:complete len:223 (+) Transcript_3550:3967-4635(+)
MRRDLRHLGPHANVGQHHEAALGVGSLEVQLNAGPMCGKQWRMQEVKAPHSPSALLQTIRSVVTGEELRDHLRQIRLLWLLHVRHVAGGSEGVCLVTVRIAGMRVHPVVEDAVAAAHHLHQPQVVLAHHRVACHHDVDILPQQLIQNLSAAVVEVGAAGALVSYILVRMRFDSAVLEGPRHYPSTTRRLAGWQFPLLYLHEVGTVLAICFGEGAATREGARQ